VSTYDSKKRITTLSSFSQKLGGACEQMNH
jgi:hypothetical protein